MLRSNGTTLPTPTLLAVVAAILWAVWYSVAVGGRCQDLAVSVSLAGCSILFLTSDLGTRLPRWLRITAMVAVLLGLASSFLVTILN